MNRERKAMVWYEVLTWKWAEGTEKKHENLNSLYPVFRRMFEARNFQLLNRNATDISYSKFCVTSFNISHNTYMDRTAISNAVLKIPSRAHSLFYVPFVFLQYFHDHIV
jgi:hypothetical protein